MPVISIKSEIIFNLFGFPVTNSILTSWIVVLFLIATVYLLSRKIKSVPGKAQSIAELAIEKLLDFLETIAGDRKTAVRYFPIVATIFFFVLISNWFGILPGVGSIGVWHETEKGLELVPIFRSVNSDLNMTLALAFIVITITHVIGLSVIGFKHHVGKFISFKGPIAFFVGILELVSEFAKILSFSFRLFGNVFAGEVLLAIMSFLVPYIVPTPFLALEIFVGFIQALIFATLSMMFFASATRNH